MESTLIAIIKSYEEFKNGLSTNFEEDNLANFTAFLNGRVGELEDQIPTDEIVSWKNFNRQTLMEMSTAYLGKMGRYVDNYARKSMPLTPIPTVEEFTYLILLLQNKSMSKSDVIKHNAHPITTGTEIIKRLLKKEYIIQFPDLNDKRKTRIAISEKGKKALFSSTDTTKKLAIIAMGTLSNQELIHLLSALKKLDYFHEKIHIDNKNFTVDELLIKYKTELEQTAPK